MKTSNKLLTAAFVAILIAMIIANISAKKRLEKLKIEQKSEINQDSDSIVNDSISTHYQIHIN
jgi:hypothetical protein